MIAVDACFYCGSDNPAPVNPGIAPPVLLPACQAAHIGKWFRRSRCTTGRGLGNGSGRPKSSRAARRGPLLSAGVPENTPKTPNARGASATTLPQLAIVGGYYVLGERTLATVSRIGKLVAGSCPAVGFPGDRQTRSSRGQHDRRHDRRQQQFTGQRDQTVSQLIKGARADAIATAERLPTSTQQADGRRRKVSLCQRRVAQQGRREIAGAGHRADSCRCTQR